MINGYPVKEDIILHNNVIISGRQQLYSDSIDVRKANSCILTIRGIQHNAAESNDPYAKVDIITSPNNVHFDTWTSNAQFTYTYTELNNTYKDLYHTALQVTLSAGNQFQKTGNPIDLTNINYIKTVTHVYSSGNLTSASLTLITTR